jgi:hypothetical protein
MVMMMVVLRTSSGVTFLIVGHGEATRRSIEARKERVVSKNGILADGQLPIENLEEFTLDTADIAFTKDTGAHGPVNIAKSRIVGVLRDIHEYIAQEQNQD